MRKQLSKSGYRILKCYLSSVGVSKEQWDQGSEAPYSSLILPSNSPLERLMFSASSNISLLDNCYQDGTKTFMEF